MNIELLIQENTLASARLTAAIETLTGALAKYNFVGDNIPQPPPLDTSAIMTAAEVIANQAPPAKKQSGKSSSGTVKEPPASSAPSESGAATTEPAAPMEYAEMQVPGLKLYKANRDALVAILKHYGVTKLDMVPQDKWPEAKAKLEAALGPV